MRERERDRERERENVRERKRERARESEREREREREIERERERDYNTYFISAYMFSFLYIPSQVLVVMVSTIVLSVAKLSTVKTKFESGSEAMSFSSSWLISVPIPMANMVAPELKTNLLQFICSNRYTIQR